MTTLEKILQEIEDRNSKLKGVQLVAFCPEWARNIIKKYISLENNAKTTRQSRDNDGWIPCSERMPEKAKIKGVFCPKYQIMTDYGVTEGWYNPDQSGWYVLFWFMTGRFLESEIDFKKGDVPKVVFISDDGKVKVIAWRPLPEKYQPKDGEEK